MTLHLRSTLPSFPSPLPRRGWQKPEHCPQSFAPRMTRQHVWVGTPGHHRVRAGSLSPYSILLHRPYEVSQEYACSPPGHSPPPRGALRIATAPVGRAASLPCRLRVAALRRRPGLPPKAGESTRDGERGCSACDCPAAVFPPSLDLSQCTAGGLSGVKAKPSGWGCAPAWTPAPPQWRRCERREQRQNCRGPAAKTAERPRSATCNSR